MYIDIFIIKLICLKKITIKQKIMKIVIILSIFISSAISLQLIDYQSIPLNSTHIFTEIKVSDTFVENATLYINIYKNSTCSSKYNYNNLLYDCNSKPRNGIWKCDFASSNGTLYFDFKFVANISDLPRCSDDNYDPVISWAGFGVLFFLISIDKEIDGIDNGISFNANIHYDVNPNIANILGTNYLFAGPIFHDSNNYSSISNMSLSKSSQLYKDFKNMNYDKIELGFQSYLEFINNPYRAYSGSLYFVSHYYNITDFENPISHYPFEISVYYNGNNLEINTFTLEIPGEYYVLKESQYVQDCKNLSKVVFVNGIERLSSTNYDICTNHFISLSPQSEKYGFVEEIKISDSMKLYNDKLQSSSYPNNFVPEHLWWDISISDDKYLEITWSILIRDWSIISNTNVTFNGITKLNLAKSNVSNYELSIYKKDDTDDFYYVKLGIDTSEFSNQYEMTLFLLDTYQMKYASKSSNNTFFNIRLADEMDFDMTKDVMFNLKKNSHSPRIVIITESIAFPIFVMAIILFIFRKDVIKISSNYIPSSYVHVIRSKVIGVKIRLQRFYWYIRSLGSSYAYQR